MHYSLFKRTIAAKRNGIPLLYSQEKKQDLKSNAYEKIRLYKTQGRQKLCFLGKRFKKKPPEISISLPGAFTIP